DRRSGLNGSLTSRFRWSSIRTYARVCEARRPGWKKSSAALIATSWLGNRVKMTSGRPRNMPGTWLDLEPLWMARVNDYITEASKLTVADLSNRKTCEAQHNQRPIDEILAEFRSARLRLVSRVETIDPAIFARAILHPRLKTPMRLVDHLYFAAEHDDHHLAHIWGLINVG